MFAMFSIFLFGLCFSLPFSQLYYSNTAASRSQLRVVCLLMCFQQVEGCQPLQKDKPLHPTCSDPEFAREWPPERFLGPDFAYSNQNAVFFVVLKICSRQPTVEKSLY
jgi:hypothetical protein